MGKRLPAYQSHQARGLRRVTLLVPEACAMGLSSGRGPDVALLRRQPHGSLLTRRRREADSNLYGAFPCQGVFSRGWHLIANCCLGFSDGSLFGAGRPFFVPSPAIRFPERAEGVKGPKR